MYIDMKKSANCNLKSDPLTKYFQSIEGTVRSLPPCIQIRLKAQISQLVHNAELEAVSPYPGSELTYHTMSVPTTYSSTYPVTPHNFSLPQNQSYISENNQSNNQS